MSDHNQEQAMPHQRSIDNRRTVARSTARGQGMPARQRARERIAAEREARKRAEARRRFLLAGGSVAAVAAIVVALVAVKLASPRAVLHASESAAPAAVVQQVTNVPAGVLSQAGPARVITPLPQVKTAGPPLTVDGKPTIVFVSEESCPFCA